MSCRNDWQLSTESSLDDEDDDEDDDMSSLELPRRFNGHGRQPQRHHGDRRRQQPSASVHRGVQGHVIPVGGGGRNCGDKMTRTQRLRRLEEAVASGSSDIEWDCNELGVTYDQLMTYFDNLKESTAWSIIYLHLIFPIPPYRLCRHSVATSALELIYYVHYDVCLMMNSFRQSGTMVRQKSCDSHSIRRWTD